MGLGASPRIGDAIVIGAGRFITPIDAVFSLPRPRKQLAMRLHLKEYLGHDSPLAANGISKGPAPSGPFVICRLLRSLDP
jgi:hypothetical protein